MLYNVDRACRANAEYNRVSPCLLKTTANRRKETADCARALNENVQCFSFFFNVIFTTNRDDLEAKNDIAIFSKTNDPFKRPEEVDVTRNAMSLRELYTPEC